jgi:hypothetical protein
MKLATGTAVKVAAIVYKIREKPKWQALAGAD